MLTKSRYFTFALLIFFVGAEGYLRLKFGEHMILHHYPRVYTPDTVLGYRGIPNIRGYIRRPSIEKSFRLNNYGFYGPDFSADHPDSIFRILVGGSSIVEGIWAQQEDSYPAVLGKLFRERGYKVEVIDCGISGSLREWEDLNLLKESATRFHANLALFERPFPIHRINYLREGYGGYSILFTGDNADERSLSESIARRKVDWLKANTLITGVYDLSYCVRYWTRLQPAYRWNTVVECWKSYSTNTTESWQNYEERDRSVQESIDWLNAMQAEMNTSGCRLVAFEYGNNEMSDRIRASDEVKVPYISLHLPLDEKKYQHELDDHLNDLGFRITAKKLFDELSRTYIPDAYRPHNTNTQNIN